MVGRKMQAFCPRIDMLKGKHCILKIWGAPVRQKLGMILENKVVQKLCVPPVRAPPVRAPTLHFTNSEDSL